MNAFQKKLTSELAENYKQNTIDMILQRLFVMNEDKKFTSLSFIKNTDKIIKMIKDKYDNISTQRSYFQAAKIVCSLKKFKAVDKYNDIIESLINDINDSVKKQEKTDKETENWVSWEDVLKKEDELLDIRNSILNIVNGNLTNLTNSNIYDIQKHLILALYTRVAVRRLEYSNVIMVENLDNVNTTTNKYNYLVFGDSKYSFHFYNYKTFSTYGIQVIEVTDVGMIEYLDKWRTINKTQYLLIQKGGVLPLSANNLTQQLNSIFGKKISSSMLRKSFVTYTRKGEKYTSDHQDLADKMGHSVNTANNIYRKK